MKGRDRLEKRYQKFEDDIKIYKVAEESLLHVVMIAKFEIPFSLSSLLLSS